MAGFVFNRIVIVESLANHEFRSGDQLRGYLTAAEGLAAVPVEYVMCNSADDFKEIVRVLTEEATRGSKPLLHIETHGDNDGTGLVFQDGSMLDWGELSELWIPLNRATSFNLLIVVAACFGAHFLLSEFRLRTASPFWGLIGPTDLTHGPELLNGFRTFYRNLLSGADADSVFTSLEKTRLDAGEFVVESAEELFLNGIKRYLEKYCSPAMLKMRAKKNRRKLRKMGNMLGSRRIRRALSQAHSDVAFDEFVDDYFMTNDIPENRERFRATIGTSRTRFANVRKS